jgi:hypothetical protein
MTLKQLVAADLGVSASRVSQYVRAGMPLTNASDAIRWVRNNYNVRNWGQIINVPSSIPTFHGDPNIRFVR